MSTSWSPTRMHIGPGGVTRNLGVPSTHLIVARRPWTTSATFTRSSPRSATRRSGQVINDTEDCSRFHQSHHSGPAGAGSRPWYPSPRPKNNWERMRQAIGHSLGPGGTGLPHHAPPSVVDPLSVTHRRQHVVHQQRRSAARRRSPSRRNRYARRRWSSTWRPAGGPPRSARRTAPPRPRLRARMHRPHRQRLTAAARPRPSAHGARSAPRRRSHRRGPAKCSLHRRPGARPSPCLHARGSFEEIVRGA